MHNDHFYMAHALRLAEQGLNTTTPNPRVGCVIVQDEQIVGEGWHQRAGLPHAEVYALQEAGDLAFGATAYVTLEPCSHTGRTPPCADALIKAGVARVVCAMEDPNPLVAGKGLAKLQAAGIAVTVGVLQAQAHVLNIGFISRMTRQRPWVRTKIACSVDGKTALHNGQSQWITGAAARQDVQRWRAQSCAIITGSATVLQDQARLTVRDLGATPIVRQPLRILVDSQHRVPLDAPFYQAGVPYLRATIHAAELMPEALQHSLICGQTTEGKVDLLDMLHKIAGLGCNEVLLEAGASLNGAFLQAGLIDEIILYQAPILLGDKGKGLFDIAALDSMQDKIPLQLLEQRQVGQDVRLRFVRV